MSVIVGACDDFLFFSCHSFFLPCSAREARPLINFMSELTNNKAPDSAPPRDAGPKIDPKDDPCVGDNADAYAEKVCELCICAKRYGWLLCTTDDLQQRSRQPTCPDLLSMPTIPCSIMVTAAGTAIGKKRSTCLCAAACRSYSVSS